MSALKIVVICILLQSVSGQIRVIDPVIVRGHEADTCPAGRDLQDARYIIRRNVLEKLGSHSHQRPNLSILCGPGQWRRLYYLDMSDTSQSCPVGWIPVTCPVRGCTGVEGTCASAYIPSGNQAYSKVCGRVSGVGDGLPDGFYRHRSNRRNIERNYLDGVSITYGSAGSRRHIWSFAMNRAMYREAGLSV